MGTIAKTKRVAGAFSSNPVYDQLGQKLADLAAAWRGTKDPQLVRRYQAVLLTLLELGWKDDLYVELELPDELMPPEYFQRYEESAEKSSAG